MMDCLVSRSARWPITAGDRLFAWPVKGVPMSNLPAKTHHVSFLRRHWKPAAITGAGGAAVVVWFDEVVMFGEEILALIFLPLLAGVIYLFDNFVFKSHLPRREDMNKPDRDRNNGK
jgi:hypothetical protein